MIRRPPRSTQSRSSAASDVYKRQHLIRIRNKPQRMSNINPQEEQLDSDINDKSDKSYKYTMRYPQILIILIMIMSFIFRNVGANQRIILEERQLSLKYFSNYVLLNTGQQNDKYYFKICLETCHWQPSNTYQIIPLKNHTKMYIFIYDKEPVLTIYITWSLQKVTTPKYVKYILSNYSWSIFIQYNTLMVKPQFKIYEGQIQTQSASHNKQFTTPNLKRFNSSYDNIRLRQQLSTWPFVLFSIGLFSLTLWLIWHIAYIFKKYKKKQTALNLFRTSLGKYLPGVYVEQTQV